MMLSSSLLALLASALLPLSHALPAPPSLDEKEAATSSTWFLPNLDHTDGAVRGYAPDLYFANGTADYTYPVYVSVASGDSTGFVNALYSNGPTSNGQRNNGWLAAQPRVVYLAPGTYTLSSTVYLDTDTIIVGDANNPPTIAAASDFSGGYLLVGGEGDNSPNSGGESHFSVMIKNVILDTTANTANSSFVALSWRVAQNSGLVNVQINMPQGAHTGIYMGQGSSVSVGDVSFSYGNIGLHFDGHQQIQLKNLKFTDCTTGIQVDGGFTVSIFAPTCNTVGRCVVYNSGDPWVSVVDGTSINSGDFFTSNVQYPSFMVENISKDTTNSNMVTVYGTVKVGGVESIGSYIYGNVYGDNPVYQTSPTAQPPNRPSALAPGGKYPISTAPQYAGKTTSDVVNMKDSTQNGGYTLKGDGSTDDTAALQGAFNTAASAGKIAYLPFGIYKVTSTITIPAGSQVYGEGWATISGYGSAFTDSSNPTAVVQIGNPNESGSAQLQDLRFSVGDVSPGAIILQVNLAGSAPGDVAIHNSLITVGGTLDTSINCSEESNCEGAYVGLYLAPGSSAYIDNFWSWLADHATDGSSAGVRIAAKGGVLVEATAGTWLAGVGSEHWWLYNVNYNGAQNVFTSLIQSETNYHVGTESNSMGTSSVLPPAPFTPASGDPSFSWCSSSSNANCRMTIAQYYNGGSDIFHYAAGSWNFFGGNQDNMNVIDSAVSSAHLHGYCNHESTYSFMLPDGKQFGDGSSDGFGGSWGSLVADVASQS